MTLLQLQYFLEVTKTLSFTNAADNLFVAQSSLSHAILALERELGVPLFIRQYGKRLELSRFGQSLLPYAERALSEVDGAQNAITQLRNPLNGVVTILYSYINGYALVPELFENFYADDKHDDITLHFDVNHGIRAPEELLRGGEVDLTINGSSDAPGIRSHPIATQELVVAMSKHHPLAGRKRVALEELQNETLIFYEQDSSIFRRFQQMFSESGLRPNVDFCAEDWSSTLVQVALGRGYTITTHVPVDTSRIVLLELDHPLRTRTLYLHWAESRSQPPVVEYVRDYLIHHADSARLYF